MDYSIVAKKIIKLKNIDISFRDKLIDEGQLGKGYHPEMEALHIHNAEQLNEIIETIGYPTIDKVGVEANNAAWLIIQHAISLPYFMKMCAEQLRQAVKNQQADPQQLAYLSDRIAIFEGRPQLYGTSFDWDEYGELSPQLYDDIVKVDARRRDLGMNSLSEQTKVIREQARREYQSPPDNIVERNKEYQHWRQRVGWISTP